MEQYYKAYDERYKTKHHASPIVEDEVAATDDDDIRNHRRTAKANVAVFVDDGIDNIHTSCTSIVRESESYTNTCSYSSKHTGHKVLTRTE